MIKLLKELKGKYKKEIIIVIIYQLYKITEVKTY